MSLSNFASDGKLSMSTIKNALFNEEVRSKEANVDQTYALVTKHR